MPKKFLFSLLVLFLFSQAFITEVKGAGACSVSVSPTSVYQSSTSDLTFTISNTGSSALTWIKFSSTSPNFVMINGYGWQSIVNPTSITFTNGSLATSSSANFTVVVQSGSTNAPAYSFPVQASDNASGAGPVDCSGSSGVAISGAPPDTTPPDMSNLAISDLSSTSAKISWATNKPATTVFDYGTTSSYGSNITDNTLTTNHTVTITGLLANTTYHYQPSSAITGGYSNTLNDNIFATAKEQAAPAPITVTQTVTQTVTLTPKPIPIPKPVVDTTPPSIYVDTDFSKPFEEPPKISGSASDDSGVLEIDYSLDDGRNWLPVTKIKSLGAKSTSFEVVPPPLDDDNYKVKIRAKDLKGNIGFSKTYVLVIDRLPPQIGGSLIHIGPQALFSNQEGKIFTLAGVDQGITLSSVGGSTSIDLSSNYKLFSLAKNPDTGLWSGTLLFNDAGTYELNSKAVDGAGRVTQRKLTTVIVQKNGQINDGKKPITDATVALYYFDPLTQRFILWDGKPYSQHNPQQTDQKGNYKLIIPPGKYYLEVAKIGYKTLKSQIFKVEQTLPINSDFSLHKAEGIKIGSLALPLPLFEQEEIRLSLNSLSLSGDQNTKNIFEGKELPDFNLSSDGKLVSALSLRGKPTVITFLTTWSPQAASQLKALEQLLSNNQLQVLAIISQETPSSVAIFKKRGGYKVDIVADPDGVLVTPLNLQTIPTHLFVNRKGIIQKVKSGLLNKDELLESLVN